MFKKLSMLSLGIAMVTNAMIIPTTSKSIKPKNVKTVETESVHPMSTMGEMMLLSTNNYKLTDAEIDLLAKVVRAESGNQDSKGKRLVVDVILNRVDSDKFPNTVKEVIYAKNQFSTVTDGSLLKAAYTVDNTDYEAVYSELNTRIDTEIMFFTAGRYNYSGVSAYKYGDHYFSILKD